MTKVNFGCLLLYAYVCIDLTVILISKHPQLMRCICFTIFLIFFIPSFRPRFAGKCDPQSRDLTRLTLVHPSSSC